MKNTMLRKENTEDIAARRIRSRKKLIICIAAFVLFAFSVFFYLSTEILVEYDDIESGIDVSEQDGIYVFRAEIPRIGICGRYVQSSDELRDGNLLVTREIYLTATRAQLWFGKRESKIIFAVTKDGNEAEVTDNPDGTIKVVRIRTRQASYVEDGEEIKTSELLESVVYQYSKKEGNSLDFIPVGEPVILWELPDRP